MANPLTEKFETPFGAVPFPIDSSFFLPALEASIATYKDEIKGIKESGERPSFSTVLEPLAFSGRDVEKVAHIFYNLYSTSRSDDLKGIAEKFSTLLSDLSNDILLDHVLFEKVKMVFDSRMKLNLSREEMTLVEDQYRDFVRAGVLLDEKKKERLRILDRDLFALSLRFRENVLADTKSFVMFLDKADLDGLSKAVVEAALSEGKKRGRENRAAVTLDMPSYLPFMKYAHNRQLREKLYRAYSARAYGGKFDNRENVKKIAQLRLEKAMLLGYKTHAHFVLEKTMAETSSRVENFLQNLLTKAKPHALQEMEELKAYAHKNGGPSPKDFRPWDYAYWAEKLRKEKFGLDEDILRPYFKLDHVIEGAFETAKKLYGLHFKERRDIPLYHKEIRAFEVSDQNDRHLGVYYGDYFPREGKVGGAFKSDLKSQKKEGGKDTRPHVLNVFNFTRPTGTRPALLSLMEVKTLFHEFGHALHTLLSECRYPNMSGTNVFTDFVELPSQVMENWVFESECLDLFAVHFETSEKIPKKFVEKINADRGFHEAIAILRQLSFALLDMGWHNRTNLEEIDDLESFENDVIAETQLIPREEGVNVSCAFEHIFAGGYSAGYYSYKWAEVLDADAFEVFKEEGIFSQSVGGRFREHILSKGGSEHPMVLYKRFLGREPDPDALLRRANLI